MVKLDGGVPLGIFTHFVQLGDIKRYAQARTVVGIQLAILEVIGFGRYGHVRLPPPVISISATTEVAVRQ